MGFSWFRFVSGLHCPQVRTAVYHEDVGLLGSLDALAAVYGRLCSMNSLVDLEVTHCKSFYWGGVDAQQQQVQALLMGYLEDDGFAHVLTPYGSMPFVEPELQQYF